MHFEFVLELLKLALWNIDLLDTHLDLLHTDIPSKYFVCLHNVFKTSPRHVFKTSSRRLQRNIFCLLRGLQDVSEDVKVLRWRGIEKFFKACLEDFLKTSSRPTNACLVVIRNLDWNDKIPDDLWNKWNLHLDMTHD